MAHLRTRNSYGLRLGYPKSRQHHDATIDKLESTDTTPIKPSVKVLLIRGIVIIVYLLVGALVFRELEHKERDKTYWKRTLHKEREKLINEFNITLDRLLQYEHLVRRRRFEIFVEHKDWDYYQSLYFASTVTTTIGYGHITPQTQSGRLFLIIFALIGIPLNILALASVGEHITVAIFYFLRYISKKCCHKSKMNHINIKVMFVSVSLMVIMLFLGGMLYCYTEDWSYIDSIYYCFVAMATIGFGDLVPNRGRAPDSDREQGIWFLRALYISIGLSLVSTVFTALSNAMEEINLLLGRGKYANTWRPNHKDKSITDNFRPQRKNSEDKSEEISYKHKIKNHGNLVLKYKVLGKFKRRKKGALNLSDWDGLLEEAKRKERHNPSRHSPSIIRDMATKPTMVVLADQEKQTTHNSYIKNSYPKENFLLLPMLPDCETASSKISASEGSTPSTATRSDDTSDREYVELHCNTRTARRLNSSPDFRSRHIPHQNVSRNYSVPAGVRQIDDADTRRPFPKHLVHYNCNKQRDKNYPNYDGLSRFCRTNTWNTKAPIDEYDIIFNQLTLI